MPQAPPAVEDYQLRIDLAHRLLHEDGFPTDVRVAGLLVVLYGQHLSRIASIERESVDPASTPPRIKLGKNWLELPKPMGQHIADLLAQGPRRKAPFVEDARWLFLGDGAGTHLSSDRLGVRLAKYGIHAQPMRNTALFQLGTTVQPGTLSRLLDLHISTAVKWVNKSGGIYANYWGQVLRDEDDEDLDLFDPDLKPSMRMAMTIQKTSLRNLESYDEYAGPRPGAAPESLQCTPCPSASTLLAVSP